MAEEVRKKKESRLYAKGREMGKDETGKPAVVDFDKAGAEPENVEKGGDVETAAPDDRKADERQEMAHRHVAEHMAMHRRHERDHMAAKEELKPMHDRHEKEFAEMHARHESEFKAMHDRHEKQ